MVFPKKIIFGEGRLDEIGAESASCGKIALIIAGEVSARQSGILRRIEQLLEASNVAVNILEGVKPEPTTSSIDKLLQKAIEFKADVVIGVGGGSVIDTAKVIAGLYSSVGSVSDYLTNMRRFEYNGIPFIAVPTVSGSGAEVTYNAVIIDEVNKTKRSLRHWRLCADCVIADPTLTKTLPLKITAVAGMDAIVHGIEAYTSNHANIFTDNFATLAIELAYKGLLSVVKNLEDIVARRQLMLASICGGIALANAGLGAVHGLAAPIGALCKQPHGLVCAVLLPYVMEYNLDAVVDKYAKIAEILEANSGKSDHKSSAFAAIAKIEEMLSLFNLPRSLKALGVDQMDVDHIINNVSSSINYNPRQGDANSYRELLYQAIKG